MFRLEFVRTWDWCRLIRDQKERALERMGCLLLEHNVLCFFLKGTVQVVPRPSSEHTGSMLHSVKLTTMSSRSTLHYVTKLEVKFTLCNTAAIPAHHCIMHAPAKIKAMPQFLTA